MSDSTDRSLNTLKLKISYRSNKDNLIDDFYVPCMKNAVLFQRAVGYFTSSSLASAASGIAHLIHSGGKIQLIASPHLTEEDIEAIKKGASSQESIIIGAAKRSFDDIKDLLIKERLEALAWMISTGAMQVKLAVRVSSTGCPTGAIYHEKTGIFSDEIGHKVAFIGSANETASGLIDNFESIDVYCSWDDPHNRVSEKAEMFNDLWDNETTGLQIINFTDATKEILKPYTPAYAPIPEEHSPLQEGNGIEGYTSNPMMPSWLELRDYQEEAIRNWSGNDGRGSLKMATGSGKTITALAIITKLYEKAGLKAAIVLCPYKHLVDQWAREALKFNYQPLIVHTSRHLWSEDLNRKLFNLRSGGKDFLMVLTTNQSFAHEFFQSKICHFPKKTLIVADEAHNLGAKGLRKKLPESVPWRLALSATPERWFDDEGTAAIFDYFGPVLKPEFTLKDAMDCGALAPYRYFPLLVELTEDEQEQYLDLSEKIAKMFSIKGIDEEDDVMKALLLKRARLLASAENKLVAIKELMADKVGSKHWLFYCGDGRVDDPASDEEMRQIESVCRILGRELQIKVAKFTAETPQDERQRIIRDLGSGALDGLVAIRCLDEGVDIPSTENAVILASSTNPRQFIQRRGRVLRKPTKNSKKIAMIYDMITVPPLEAIVTESERSMLRKELTRFAEFASLAKNAGVARGQILELQKKYDLMDV